MASSTSPLDLIRTRYSSHDFDTYLDEARARARVKFADRFNDLVASSLMIVLWDVMAYALDSLAFYVDRRATDLYSQTALTRKGMSRVVRPLGYRLGPATSASGTILVAPSQAYAFAVTIPKGFQFRLPNGLIYEVTQAVTWDANSTAQKSVPVREGETRTFAFTSDGSKNQVMRISAITEGKFAMLGTVVATVAGGAWTESDFITATKSNQFEVDYAGVPPAVRFGDGDSGNVPAQGAAVDVTVTIGSGRQGNQASGALDSTKGATVVTPLSVNFTSINLVFSQPDAITGGTDPEEIAAASAASAGYYKAAEDAVTKPDYDGIATSFADPQFGRVAIADAVSARSAALDAALTLYCNTIRGIVSPMKASVDAKVASIATKKIETTTALTDSTAKNTDSSTKATTQKTDTATARTAVSQIRNENAQVEVDATDIETQANAAKTTINAIGTGGSDQLLSGTKTALIAKLDTILAEVTSQRAHTATVTSQSTSATNALNSVDVGADAIIANAAAGSAKIAEAQTKVDGMKTDADAAGATVTDVTTKIEEQLVLITDHVDELLSADGKANLVVVSVLTYDADGFYAAPSVSLLRSLKTKLDGIKGVTQTVSVISGASLLVAADVTCNLFVKDGVLTEKEAEANTALLDVLRGRKHSRPLNLDELYEAVRSRVTGLDHHNVKITAPVALLDAEGNLDPGKGKVVTKGVVTVKAVRVSA